MKRLFTTFITAAALLLCSCDDYVDIVPKGNTIPQSVDDFAELMANGSMAYNNDLYAFTDVSYSLLHFALYSDDYNVSQDPASTMYTTHLSLSLFQNTLKWADYIYGAAESDANWNGLYKSNYVCNYVLDNIDNAAEGVSNQREDVKGQALVHRAMNYFLLVNMYGKQYNKTTSDSDLGVPLVLTSDINKQYPRATVAQVYAQIMADLDEATGLLTQETSKYNNIPSLATAYALRARCELWMQDFDKAYEDAAQSLAYKDYMIDYNTLSAYMPGVPAYGISGYDSNVQTNPEVLYSRYLTESDYFTYTDKMLAIIDKENDLRYTLFIGDLAMSGITEPTSWYRKNHSGINVSEVWLTKAEAAVRKSSPDVDAAIDALDAVRKVRYNAATYTPTTTTDKDVLLKEILDERRREITFTEMSFLDKKRLNQYIETAAPMERTAYGETFTMPVGDPHWQLAIPLDVMALNPLLVQNER